MDQDIESAADSIPDIKAQRASTGAIFLYLFTVIAWIVEGVVLLLHLTAAKKIEPVAHAVLLFIWAALTVFTWRTKRKRFRDLAFSANRGPLSTLQVLIIVLFFLVIGAVCGFIGVRLDGR